MCCEGATSAAESLRLVLLLFRAVLLGVNKADRLISAATLVLALLPEATQKFVGGQRDIKQLDLTPDGSKVTRCEIIQLVQYSAVLGFIRAAELFGLRKKQSPTLLWFQVIKFYF